MRGSVIGAIFYLNHPPQIMLPINRAGMLYCEECQDGFISQAVAETLSSRDAK